MDKVLEQIKKIARKYKIKQVILFGSRARGNHSPDSDYDIAVHGPELSLEDKANFCAEVESINESVVEIELAFFDLVADFSDLLEYGVIVYDSENTGV